MNYFVSKKFTCSIFFCLNITLSFSAFSAQTTNQPYESALTSFHLEDLNSAVVHLKNALKNNPSHLPSRLLMAEILVARGDGVGAEIELAFAEQGNADVKRILPLKLEALILQNRYEQVINLAKVIPGNNRISSVILAYKGQALFSKNNATLAQVEYKKALKLNNRNVKALLGLAEVANKKGRYNVTMDYLAKILTISPLNTNAMQMKANIFQLKGETEKAMVAISSAININNKHFPALLTRASIFIEQNNFQLALDDVEVILTDIPNEPRANYLKVIITRALGLDEERKATQSHLDIVLTGIPDNVMQENPIYYYLAGLVNYENNQHIKAQDELRKYVNIISDDVRALKLLGKVELALNEAFSAKNYLVKARLISPDDVEVWALLGRSYLLTGDIEKAERYLLDVVDALPLIAGPLYNLGKMQLAAGKQKKAIQSLVKAKGIRSDSDTLFLLANAYHVDQQIERAFELINELIGNQGEVSYLYQKKGILLGSMGKHDQAKEAFEVALNLDENNIEALVHLARIDMIEGNIKEARNRIIAKLEILTGNTLLLVELGNTFTTKGEIEQAKTNYEKAYSLNRGSKLALLKIVDVFIAQSEIVKAIDITKEYLGRNSQNSGVQLIAARLYMMSKQYENAISAHQISVKHANDKGKMLIAYANSQLIMNNVEGAILSLQRAIGWNDDLLKAHLQLIDVYAHERQQDNAIAAIEKLERKSDNKAMSHALFGDVYFYNEQLKQSVEAYKLSLSLEHSKKAMYGLYKVYKKQHAYNSADKLLKNWLKENPNDILMAIALADNYVAQSDLSSAVNYYDDLITQHGELPVLLNNAAQLNVTVNNIAQALVYAENAYRKMPNVVAIKDTMAWVYTKNNELDKALPIFREALAIDSENAEIKYHLAVALNLLGRSNEAIRYLQDIIESNQIFSGKNDAEKLLIKLKKSL